MSILLTAPTLSVLASLPAASASGLKPNKKPTLYAASTKLKTTSGMLHLKNSKFMNFEFFKCSIPDVVFSLVEAAYSVGFLFGFKPEAEAAGKLANTDNVGAVRRIDMEAVDCLLTAFGDILGGHC